MRVSFSATGAPPGVGPAVVAADGFLVVAVGRRVVVAPAAADDEVSPATAEVDVDDSVLVVPLIFPVATLLLLPHDAATSVSARSRTTSGFSFGA